MREVRIGKGWGYWDLTNYPRGGCFGRLTEDTTLTVDAEHAGELYGKLPDGRRICIQGRACLPMMEGSANG
jgi:hypothetical protein